MIDKRTYQLILPLNLIGIISSLTVPLRGTIKEGYSVGVKLGTPPQKFNLLLDTGSSNLAVAGNSLQNTDSYFHREKSSTLVDYELHQSVRYSQGSFSGNVVGDMISFTRASNFTPIKVQFVEITKSDKFFLTGVDWQGIMGLGYSTLAPEIDSFWEIFRKAQGIADIFAIQLCGLKAKYQEGSSQGFMTLGSISTSMYKGAIQYTPIIEESYYQILISDIKIANISLGMDCKEFNYQMTIVDSGTSDLRLPTRVHKIVVNHIRQIVSEYFKIPDSFWSQESEECWDESFDVLSYFPNISLLFPTNSHFNETFEVTLSSLQYISKIQDEEDPSNCYRFSISKSDSITVIGATLMEGFYIVFDRTESRIGFAQSACVPVTTVSEETAFINSTNCEFKKTFPNEMPMMFAAYVIAVVSVVSVSFLTLALVCSRKPRYYQLPETTLLD